MMVIIDKHSVGVMDKHYILKDPEDDVALAKALVEKIFGDTVEWPSNAKIESTRLEAPTWYTKVMGLVKGTDDEEALDDGVIVVAGHASDDEPEDEEDDVQLQDWDHGNIFGILGPGQLEVIPLMDDPEFAHVDPNGSQQLLPLPSIPQFPGLGEIPSSAPSSSKRSAPQELDVQASKKTKVIDQNLASFPDASANKATKASKQEPAKQLAIANKASNLYAEYAPPARGPGYTKRNKVADVAHAWMVDKLQKWQALENKKEYERPNDKNWYLDARIECIKAGFLTRDHSEDVVRSYLKSYVHNLLKKPEYKKVAQDDGIDVD